MPASATIDRPRRRERSRVSRTGRGVLYPLDLAYRQAGLSAPEVELVAPTSLPQPFQSLLAHQRDMTITLEEHWGGRVVLRVLAVFSKRSWYFRRVLLSHEYSGRPVEMGAIRLNLEAFPSRVRTSILKHEVPLGRVLRDGDVNYVSRPKAFFSVTPNSEMMGVFWMREPRLLYGRRTEVFVDGRNVGDIVEILPPA